MSPDSSLPRTAGYLREIGRQPMLSRAEEVELTRRVHRGDAAAAARLVASHLRFVLRVARGYRNYGVPMSDLIQEGTIGLIQAIRRFNPERNVRLATYAAWWIRAAIQDYVVRSWSLVRIGHSTAQRTLFFKLRRMRAELADGADSLGDEIVAALARGLRLPASDVTRMAQRAARPDESLNLAVGEASEEWIDRLAAGGPSPEEAAAAASETRFLRSLLHGALARLSPRERLIIHKRYLAEAASSFEAVGRELGVSKERVRQLEARALAKLRRLMGPVAGDRIASNT